VSDYTIIFDGGSHGNPGAGYGSYRLTRNADRKRKTRRLDFGAHVTNNVAEYRALIAALEDLATMVGAAGKRPADFSVEVWGDSLLVVEQMNGRWKVRHENMKPLHEQALSLFRQFGEGSSINWHPRGNSVRALGH
jgi:ribonuclease HI